MVEVEQIDGAPEKIGSALGYVFFVGVCLLMAWTIIGRPYLGL
jgi:hypothetical protein